MGLKEIELQKFKEGFKQFSAQEIRELFEYVKNLRYNSSAAAPLQMDNTPNGMALSIQQDVGILIKVKANIADGATGAVILTDLDFNEIGDEFDAKNFTGSAVVNGETKLQIGRDPSGQPFFRKTEGTAVCGPGDCPDSCIDVLDCFEVVWVQGASSGSFFIPVNVQSACIVFQAPAANPNGFGSVIDPVTGREWFLTVEWDACVQMILYTLTDCSGFPVPIDEILGGTIPAPACASDIEILIFPGATCPGTNTFPCCDPLEGCTCPSP